MKSSYINPSDWIDDLSSAISDPSLKEKRLAKVTNEYISDTVITDGVVPEDTGDLKRDIQRKSVPKNGIVMTNLSYSIYANEHNITGQTDYLEVMWKQQPGVYREMYGDLLVNDINRK